MVSSPPGGMCCFSGLGPSLAGIGFSLLLRNLSRRPEFLWEPIVSECRLVLPFITSLLQRLAGVWEARSNLNVALMFSQC